MAASSNVNCGGLGTTNSARVSHLTAEGERRHGQHFIADAQTGHARADRRDPAAALGAEWNGTIAESGINAQRFHDIAEIQSRGDDFDLDVSRTGRLPPQDARRQDRRDCPDANRQTIRLVSWRADRGQRSRSRARSDGRSVRRPRRAISSSSSCTINSSNRARDTGVHPLGSRSTILQRRRGYSLAMTRPRPIAGLWATATDMRLVTDRLAPRVTRIRGAAASPAVFSHACTR